MDSSEITVRLARLADVEAVVSTVAAAFADDPAWTFMLTPGHDGASAAFARTLLLPRIRRGTAWVTDDGAAVAMWDRRWAGDAPDADHQERWARFRAEVGEDAWTRVEAYDNAVIASGPPRPYWYLGVLATHPDHRGRGLATAVLGPGLAAAAAEGVDCWLETSTPSNKDFYARRGFTEAVPVDVPGGPPTWWMRRADPGRRSSAAPR